MADLDVRGSISLTDRVSRVLTRVEQGVKKFSSKVENANRVANRFGTGLQKMETRATGASGGIGALIGRLSALVGATTILKGLFDVNREFEKLELNLKTVTGSSEEAKLAFDFIQDVASTVPESVQDITTAFIRMKSLGLTPTREALVSFANTASAMGQDIMQFVEAVADASVGEFERLLQFGIKARSEGDKVKFTFQGITTTVKKNATEITDYLQKIGEVKFAGAATDKMQTINGLLSNMGDNLAKLGRRIGQGVLADAFKQALKYAIAFVEGVLENFDLIEYSANDLSFAIQTGWLLVKRGFLIVSTFIVYAFDKMVDKLVKLWNDFIGSIQDTANKLGDFFGFDPIFEQVKRGTDTVGDFDSVLKELNADIDAEHDALRKAYDATNASITATAKAALVTTDYNEKLKQQKKVQDEQSAANEEAKKKQEALDEAKKEGVKVTENLRTATEVYRDELKKLQDLRNKGAISQETYNRGVVAASQALREAQAELDKTKPKVDQLGEHLKSAAQSMQQTFSQFFFDILEGKMTDFYEAFKQMINRIVAEIAAAKLFEFLLGDFGTSGQVGGLFGGLFRAEGGPVASGRPYIVGERGPELVVPRASGYVLPAEQTAGLVTPSISFQFSPQIDAVDGASVLKVIQPVQREFASLMTDTIRRYGMKI